VQIFLQSRFALNAFWEYLTFAEIGIFSLITAGFGNFESSWRGVRDPAYLSRRFSPILLLLLRLGIVCFFHPFTSLSAAAGPVTRKRRVQYALVVEQ
jgi:hypothetical protein